MAVMPNFCRWIASNTFQLENGQVRKSDEEGIDRLVRAGACGFHELYDLCAPNLLKCGFLGVHSGGLPLERRRSGWHRYP